MKGLRSIRALSRESMRGVTILPIQGHVPTMELANPRDLFVEEVYQREVRESGTALIRKIAGAFSWHKFKPPICFRSSEADGALVVIDGQHTATAAATRGIALIPILVVSEDASLADRAGAFVGHNKDRLSLTQQMVFHAQLASGDRTAIAARDACSAAGVKILPYAVNLAEERDVGDTIAIGTISKLSKRYGPERLTRVLKVLVAAKRGPIKAQEIGAVSNVLGHLGNEKRIDEQLAALIASKPAKQWAAIAAAVDGTITHALTTVWMRELDVRAPAPAKLAAYLDVPRLASSLPPQMPDHDKPIAPPVNQIVETVKPPERAVPVNNCRAPDPPPPKKVSIVFLAQANGVSVTAEGMVSRVGAPTAVNVGRTGARLVARLVSVMPAQIGFDRLADKVFEGQASRRQKLDDLVASVNPDLRKLRLEIFHVKASGYMIREMANSGDNRLLA